MVDMALSALGAQCFLIHGPQVEVHVVFPQLNGSAGKQHGGANTCAYTCTYMHCGTCNYNCAVGKQKFTTFVLGEILDVL